jgi:hypothetical protein
MLTPTPAPVVPDTTTAVTGVSLAISLVAVLLLGMLFVWAILRAAQYEAPASLIVALSLLTFLSLVGAIAASSTELTTLAATGIGALAGAVSSQFGDLRRARFSEDDGSEGKTDTLGGTSEQGS